MAQANQKYVLAVDVGTTCAKASVYDASLNIISKSTHRIAEYEPGEPGASEIKPDDLWNATVEVIKEAIATSGKSVKEISCMGLCVQRNSFITWDGYTGQPFHNFITWKDKRSQGICDEWNASKVVADFRAATGMNLMFFPAYTCMRLLWALKNVDSLRDAVADGRARFGCVETWLIWRLTGGRIWTAEESCESLTGLYDIFRGTWMKDMFTMLDIPMSILPPLSNSVADFGTTDEATFGGSIPITAVLADQSASMVGECSFKKAAAKLTIGTGGFLNVVIDKPFIQTILAFPTLAYKGSTDAVFAAEVYLPPASYIGNIVDTLVQDGYISDFSKLDEVANSVADSAGVVFIPNPGDGSVGHRIEGRTPDTKPAHVVRAALQAIADIVKALGEQLELEAPHISVVGKVDKEGNSLPPLRIDGGVARSDFVCQAIANAVGRDVERLNDVEASVRGTGMLAGFGGGVFSSIAQVEALALGDELSRKLKVFASST